MQSSKASLRLAEETYQKAVELFKIQYTDDESKRKWLDGKDSFQDVEDALLQAKAKYDGRSQSSVRKYLQKFSATTMHYSKIMDMLVQHHPEYVSLAWGTMKLLFVLVLNQEELVEELAKSLARIADVLPRVDMHLHLYPTDAMKRAVEDLYALLISFYQRALRWYEERPIKHAIKAFLRPYPLRFEDLVEKIQHRAGEIESLAITMAHKDIRGSYEVVRSCLGEQKSIRADQQAMKVDQTRTETILVGLEQEKAQTTALLMSMKDLLTSHQTVNSGILLTTQRVTQETQVAMMIAAATPPSLLQPFESLRRRQRLCAKMYSSGAINFDSVWQAPAVRSWSTSSDSALLMMNGTNQFRNHRQAAATFMTELLRTAKAPVLWALKSPCGRIAEESLCDVLKYLAMQALQLDPNRVGQTLSPGFNAALVAGARNEDDWMRILSTLLSRIPKVFLVVDEDILGPLTDHRERMEALIGLLQGHLLSQSSTVVKVVLVSQSRLATASSGHAGGVQSVFLDRLFQQNVGHAMLGRGSRGHLRQRGALAFKRRVAKI